MQRSVMAGAATSLLPSAVKQQKLLLRPPAPISTRQIGVRPLVNAKGTYTIISGSLSLPEVKQAMEEASRHYVNMDELMAAVGARLATITGADWGIVTAGCAAAITGATAACIAGTDPEKSQKMPYLEKGGLKSQVIIPKHSRNPYDVGARLLGVEVVEVETPEQLEASMGPQTAMIYILSSPAAATGPLSIANICQAAKRRTFPSLSTPRQKTSPSPIFILRQAQPWLDIAGVNACADRNARDCCWDARTWCRQPGSRRRRTTMWDAL